MLNSSVRSAPEAAVPPHCPEGPGPWVQAVPSNRAKMPPASLHPHFSVQVTPFSVLTPFPVHESLADIGQFELHIDFSFTFSWKR